MTREEAIDILQNTSFFGRTVDDIDTAIQMATKALEQEPCEDAISREWLKIAIHNFYHGLKHTPTEEDIQAYIDAAPPVTPSLKMGRWIAYEVRLPDRTILNYRCSVCGRKLIGYSTETLSEAPFCHCGAKMVEPQERSDKE